MVSLFFGSWFSMSISLLLMGTMRGLLFLLGLMFSVLCSVDRSIHWSFTASLIRMAVSLSACNSMDVRLPHEAMSWSISVSVGMNGIVVSVIRCGLFHVICRNLSSAL